MDPRRYSLQQSVPSAGAVQCAAPTAASEEMETGSCRAGLRPYLAGCGSGRGLKWLWRSRSKPGALPGEEKVGGSSGAGDSTCQVKSRLIISSALSIWI